MSFQIIEGLSESEWLQKRARNINSTETAALFSASKWSTEFELFHNKKSGDVLTLPANKRMTAGQILEPAIANLALLEIGGDGLPFKDYAEDFDARIGSSFDWYIENGKYQDWLLEIKNVDFMIYRDEWESDEAPVHIEIQVQHQLMARPASPGTIIAALVGGNELKIIPRPRNDEMIEVIRNRIAKFWDDIDNDNEPVPDFQRDAEFIISLHQSAGFEPLYALENREINEAFGNYYEKNEQKKRLEKELKADKALIFEMIGDDYNKVIADDGLSLSCGMVKTTEPTLITPEMVGQTYGGRKGSRMFRLNKKKTSK